MLPSSVFVLTRHNYLYLILLHSLYDRDAPCNICWLYQVAYFITNWLFLLLCLVHCVKVQKINKLKWIVKFKFHVSHSIISVPLYHENIYLLKIFKNLKNFINYCSHVRIIEDFTWLLCKSFWSQIKLIHFKDINLHWRTKEIINNLLITKREWNIIKLYETIVRIKLK